MKHKPLIIAFLFITGIFLLFFSSKDRDTEQLVAVGHAAPDFEVLDAVNGKKLSSSELKGKVIFINFWAEWCKTCKEEMPSIEALFREISIHDSFRMITILYKDSSKNGVKYMSSNGYTFPVYVDIDRNSARNFRVTGVPETYIIDKKGILRRAVIGPADWYTIAEKTFINSLLNE